MTQLYGLIEGNVQPAYEWLRETDLGITNRGEIRRSSIVTRAGAILTFLCLEFSCTATSWDWQAASSFGCG